MVQEALEAMVLVVLVEEMEEGVVVVIVIVGSNVNPIEKWE